MAGNTRVDELRKRLEKEPGSRLFAQLAEELRKDGDLDEAIRVSREGLQKHPQYPSARITLGRALLDTGDAAAASREFDLVLRAAPDNIVASRYLGEALEAAGDVEGARKRYRQTLALSPGDKNVLARLEALDTSPAPQATQPGVPAWPGVPPPPAPVPEPDMAPIKLVEADVEFELEQPHVNPVPWPAGSRPRAEGTGDPFAAAPAPQPPPTPPAAPAVVTQVTPDVEQDFDFEAPAATVRTVAFEPTMRVPLLDDVVAPPPSSPPAPAAPPPPPPPPPPGPAEDVEPIASATLAELYFNQGFTQRALEVYRKLLEREPFNDRARNRAAELESYLAAIAPATTASPMDRRARLERTIEKLETLRRALQAGPA